ncbi:MAG: hypothetical protein RL480_182 [Pseudomonadota bacterium]
MYQLAPGSAANEPDLGPTLPEIALPEVALTKAVRERGWTWWLGIGISAAILVAVVLELRQVDLARVRAMLPASSLFWLVFIISYLSAPAADWLIYRRLWRIPVAGFGALLRKLVGNELLVGYVGELYLYTWARRRTAMTSAPFGAIKDVAILSAMVANAVTLVLIVLAYPLLGTLHLGVDTRTLLISVSVIVATSTAILFLRKTLFSLPRRDLYFVAGVHLVRIGLTTGLAALCWHLALPGVALQWWLLLATLRMLLSRLPLLPNKDIVFAGLAVFLIGHDAEIGALMTMMASLILCTHLFMGLGLVASEARGIGRR